MEIENANINDIDIEEVVELEVDVEQIGPRGLSAYEIYIKNGGRLSEIEWLLNLKGETGNSGVYIGGIKPIDPDVNIWIDTSDGDILAIAEEGRF